MCTAQWSVGVFVGWDLGGQDSDTLATTCSRALPPAPASSTTRGSQPPWLSAGRNLRRAGTGSAARCCSPAGPGGCPGP